jgi:hypothetical protein
VKYADELFDLQKNNSARISFPDGLLYNDGPLSSKHPQIGELFVPLFPENKQFPAPLGLPGAEAGSELPGDIPPWYKNNWIVCSENEWQGQACNLRVR